MTINSRLTEFRNSTGLSQVKFAEKLGLTQSAYKNYETGERKIPVPILQTLADVYSVDMNWLLTGSKKLTYHNELNGLTSIIQDVLSYQTEQSLSFSPQQNSKLITTLFRTYLKYGEIDHTDIKDYCYLMSPPSDE